MRPGSIIIFGVCLLVIICAILGYFRLKSLMKNFVAESKKWLEEVTDEPDI